MATASLSPKRLCVECSSVAPNQALQYCVSWGAAVKRIIQLKNPIATLVGLAIALTGIPIFMTGYRMISGENHSDWQVVVREIGVFFIVGVLRWIVQQKEALPLS